MAAPLRVMLDARMLIGRFSGVARLVTRLVEQLAEAEGIEVVALCGELPYEPWSGRSDIEMIPSSFSRSDRSPVRRCVWEAVELSGLIRRARVDVFHATWNTGVPPRCPVPCVLTVHDLIPWREPARSLRHRLALTAYRRAVRSSARRAAIVTTVSDFVRADLLRTMRIDPDKVCVVPNGVDAPAIAPTDRPPGRTPNVLYVGGHERRKNLPAVFAAMRRYWERWHDDLELRLTGARATLNRDAAGALDRLAHPDRVRFLGSLTDAELAREYANATLLLMLSNDEGFGLPVIEAMAYGCPVVAADRASLPEVAGDAGALVDPDNVDAVCDAMRRIATDAHYRQNMIARGLRRADSFRWSDVARQMRSVYARTARSLNGASRQRTCARVAP